MRILFVILCFGVVIQLTAQKMAITLDDAPFGYSAGMSDEVKIERFENLLSVLKKYNVKATFMVTSSNMNEKTKAILKRALEEGHQLGNHTHRHMSLSHVSAKAYMTDVDSCIQLTTSYLNSNYFRYSYLRRGNTSAKRDSVYRFLADRGLRVAPVTIDNNEWEYNRDYSVAKRDGKPEVMTKQLNDYLKHMKEITDEYRQKAIDLIGEDIPHVLLIHVNPINCDHLDKLLSQYVNDGWKFVSLDEAMTHSFYQLTDDYIGQYGASQIDRIRQAPSDK